MKRFFTHKPGDNMRFTFKLHIPPKYNELRWCIFKDGAFFCDRNEYVDAKKLCDMLNRVDRREAA